MTDIVDTSTSTTPVETAGRKQRVRKAPFVRVALQLEDGSWEFYESARAMDGVRAKRAVVLSGAANAGVAEAIEAAVIVPGGAGGFAGLQVTVVDGDGEQLQSSDSTVG